MATALTARRRSPALAITRASAGPSTRRFVIAAPIALPIPSAPAAARPPLPYPRASGRLRRGSGCTRLRQHRPATAQPDAERAEPVIQQPDANTLSRLFGERFGKPEPDLIPMNNVGLEMDGALGGRDGLEPSRIVLFPILQNPLIVVRAGHRSFQPVIDLQTALGSQVQRGRHLGAPSQPTKRPHLRPAAPRFLRPVQVQRQVRVARRPGRASHGTGRASALGEAVEHVVDRFRRVGG